MDDDIDEYDFEPFEEEVEEAEQLVVPVPAAAAPASVDAGSSKKRSKSIEELLAFFADDLGEEDDDELSHGPSVANLSTVSGRQQQSEKFAKPVQQDEEEVVDEFSLHDGHAVYIEHFQSTYKTVSNDEHVSEDSARHSDQPFGRSLSAEESNQNEAAPEPTKSTDEAPFDPTKLKSLKQKSLSRRKQTLLDSETPLTDQPISSDNTEPTENAAPAKETPEESYLSPKKRQIGLINAKLQQERNRQQSDQQQTQPQDTQVEVSRAAGAVAGAKSSGVRHSIQSEFAQLGVEALSPPARRKGGGVGMGPTITAAAGSRAAGEQSAGGAAVRGAYGKMLPQRKVRDSAAAGSSEVAPISAELHNDRTEPETREVSQAADKRKPSFSAVGKWGKEPVLPSATGRPQRVSLKPALPARKFRPTRPDGDPGADGSAASADQHAVQVPVYKPIPPAAPKPSLPRQRQAPPPNKAQQPHIPSSGQAPAPASHRRLVPSGPADAAAAVEHPEEEVEEDVEEIPDLMPASVLEENSTYLSLLEAHSPHPANTRGQGGEDKGVEGSTSTVKLNADTHQRSPDSHSKKAHLHARFASEDDEEYDTAPPPLSAPTREPHQSPTDHYYKASSRSQPDHHAAGAIKKRPVERALKPATHKQAHDPYNPYHSGPIPPKTKRLPPQTGVAGIGGGSGKKGKKKGLKLHKGKDWMADPTHRYDPVTGLFSSFEKDAQRESRKEQVRINAALRRAAVEREAELARLANLQRLHEIEVVERQHEECLLVSGMNQAERAEAAVLEQRLAELRRVAQERESAVQAQLMSELAAHSRKQQQPLTAAYAAPPSTSPPRHHTRESPARRRLYQPYGAGSGNSPDAADQSPEAALHKRISDDDHSPSSIVGSKPRSKHRPGSTSTVGSVASAVSQAQKGKVHKPRGPAEEQSTNVAPVQAQPRQATKQTNTGSTALAPKAVVAKPSPAKAAPAPAPIAASVVSAAATKVSNPTSRSPPPQSLPPGTISAEPSIASIGQEHSATLDGGSTSSDPSRAKRRGSLKQIAGLSAAASLVKVDLFGDEVDVTTIQQDISRGLDGVPGVLSAEDEEVQEGVDEVEDTAYYLSAVQSMVGIDAADANNIVIHDFYGDSPRAQAVQVDGMTLEDAFIHAGELDLPLEGSGDSPAPVTADNGKKGDYGDYSDDGWEDEEEDAAVTALAKRQVGTPLRKDKGVPQWEDEEVLDQSEEVPAYEQPRHAMEEEEVESEPVDDTPVVAAKPNKEVRVVHATFADTVPTSREGRSRGAADARRRSSPSTTRRMQLVSPPVSSAQMEAVFSDHNVRRKSTPKLRRKTPTASNNHSGASSRQRSRAASAAAAEGNEYGQDDFEDYDFDEFEQENVLDDAGEALQGTNATALPDLEEPADTDQKPNGDPWLNNTQHSVGGEDSQLNSPLLGLRLGGSVDLQDSLAFSTASTTLHFTLSGTYSPSSAQKKEFRFPESSPGIGADTESVGDFRFYVSQPNSLYEAELDGGVAAGEDHVPKFSGGGSGGFGANKKVETVEEPGDNYSDDADFEQPEVEEAVTQPAPAQRNQGTWSTGRKVADEEDEEVQEVHGYSPLRGIAAAQPNPTIAAAPTVRHEDPFSDSFEEPDFPDFAPTATTKPSAAAAAVPDRKTASPLAPPKSAGAVSDEYADETFETGEDGADDGNDQGLLFFNDGAAVELQSTTGGQPASDHELDRDEVEEPTHTAAAAENKPGWPSTSYPTVSSERLRDVDGKKGPATAPGARNYDSDEDFDFTPTVKDQKAPTVPASVADAPAPAPYAVRQFSMVVKDPDPHSAGAGGASKHLSMLGSVGTAGTTYDAKKEEVLRRIQLQQQSVEKEEEDEEVEVVVNMAETNNIDEEDEFSHHWGKTSSAGADKPSPTFKPSTSNAASALPALNKQNSMGNAQSGPAVAAEKVMNTSSSVQDDAEDDEYNFGPSKMGSTPSSYVPTVRAPTQSPTLTAAAPAPAPYAVRQFSMVGGRDPEPPTAAPLSKQLSMLGSGSAGTTYDAKKEEVLRRIQLQQQSVEEEDEDVEVAVNKIAEFTNRSGVSKSDEEDEFSRHWGKTSSGQTNKTDARTASSDSAPPQVGSVRTGGLVAVGAPTSSVAESETKPQLQSTQDRLPAIGATKSSFPPVTTFTTAVHTSAVTKEVQSAGEDGYGYEDELFEEDVEELSVQAEGAASRHSPHKEGKEKKHKKEKKSKHSKHGRKGHGKTDLEEEGYGEYGYDDERSSEDGDGDGDGGEVGDQAVPAITVQHTASSSGQWRPSQLGYTSAGVGLPAIGSAPARSAVATVASAAASMQPKLSNYYEEEDEFDHVFDSHAQQDTGDGYPQQKQYDYGQEEWGYETTQPQPQPQQNLTGGTAYEDGYEDDGGSYSGSSTASRKGDKKNKHKGGSKKSKKSKGKHKHKHKRAKYGNGEDVDLVIEEEGDEDGADGDGDGDGSSEGSSPGPQYQHQHQHEDQYHAEGQHQGYGQESQYQYQYQQDQEHYGGDRHGEQAGYDPYGQEQFAGDGQYNYGKGGDAGGGQYYQQEQGQEQDDYNAGSGYAHSGADPQGQGQLEEDWGGGQDYGSGEEDSSSPVGKGKKEKKGKHHKSKHGKHKSKHKHKHKNKHSGHGSPGDEDSTVDDLEGVDSGGSSDGNEINVEEDEFDF